MWVYLIVVTLENHERIYRADSDVFYLTFIESLTRNIIHASQPNKCYKINWFIFYFNFIWKDCIIYGFEKNI